MSEAPSKVHCGECKHAQASWGNTLGWTCHWIELQCSGVPQSHEKVKEIALFFYTVPPPAGMGRIPHAVVRRHLAASE